MSYGVRFRFALADSVFAGAAVAVAAATVWFFLFAGRPAAASPEASGARIAADAFVGAVKGADADGVCALLSERLRRQHARCRPWAKTFIGATTDGRYAVLAVVMQRANRARVRVLIDGDHFFWFFVRQGERWRFDEITAVPLR